MVVVGVVGIEEIGVGGVHPPCVNAIVEEGLQMIPIYLTCHGAIGVIHPYARGIIHAWRPDVRQSALRPCLEVEEQSLLVELAILLCHRTEARPDGDHDMGIVFVYKVNHLLAVGKLI